jgi:hypothetical protein
MGGQTTIFSDEQEAIIKEIYISKGKVATMIATELLEQKKRKGQTDVDTEPLRNHGEREGR